MRMFTKTVSGAVIAAIEGTTITTDDEDVIEVSHAWCAMLTPKVGDVIVDYGGGDRAVFDRRDFDPDPETKGKKKAKSKG